jgi:hypothetical protein
MARPGDIFKKSGPGAYTIESGLADWTQKQRKSLYSETAGQRGYQENALAQMALQAADKGPSIVGRQADLAEQGAQGQISQQLGTAGGGPQAARQAIIGTGALANRTAGASMGAAAQERLGRWGAMSGGVGQVVKGRTGLEQLAQGYGQMGQLDKFRAQQMAAMEKEREFQRQLVALGLEQQRYADTANIVMGGLQGAAGAAQMYGSYTSPGKSESAQDWGSRQGDADEWGGGGGGGGYGGGDSDAWNPAGPYSDY